MDTYELFVRYSVAIVSKKITRKDMTTGPNKVTTKQRLCELEKISFDNYSYKTFERINKYLTKRGL